MDEHTGGSPNHGAEEQLDQRMLESLGSLVRESANLERQLRSLVCALTASKYAAVLAAGRSTHELIIWSVAILKVHR